MGFNSAFKGLSVEIACNSVIRHTNQINPLNAELNPIYHLLALLESHHILHVRRIRVKLSAK